MSQNPCRSMHVVIFSPRPSSQSSTRPVNCLKRSFINSLAWPTTVRIRSLTKKKTRGRKTELYLFCSENTTSPRSPYNSPLFGCKDDKLTLFWDGLIFHFSLPVTTKSCQSVCLTGNFRSEWYLKEDKYSKPWDHIKKKKTLKHNNWSLDRIQSI